MMLRILTLLVASGLALASFNTLAACNDVSRNDLKDAIAVADLADTGGFDLQMWLVMVDETGKVCHVLNSSGMNGRSTGNTQWLGSRVIAAQKAFTANAFSLDGYAISTANLYTATQPGGSLFALPESNPVDARIAYAGPASKWGTNQDPLKGKRMGGINVFGGGIPIYKLGPGGEKIGAIGVSGDTSCRDHAYAFQVREALKTEFIAGSQPSGTGITTVNFLVSGDPITPITGATTGDEMILDITTVSDQFWEPWEHAPCPNTATQVGISGYGILEN